MMSQTSVENVERLLKAKNAFIAGCLDSWAVMLDQDPEFTRTIIKDMRELADSLKKSAGVVMFNAD